MGRVLVKAVPARMSACSLRGRAIRSWHKGQYQDFGAVLASGWAIQAPLCGLTLLASTLAHWSTFCGGLSVFRYEGHGDDWGEGHGGAWWVGGTGGDGEEKGQY